MFSGLFSETNLNKLLCGSLVDRTAHTLPPAILPVRSSLAGLLSVAVFSRCVVADDSKQRCLHMALRQSRPSRTHILSVLDLGALSGMCALLFISLANA